MSNQISVAFVQQFSDNLIMLAQQKGSKLRDTVMNKVITGNAAYFERLGATVAQLRTTRHGDTPIIDTPHSRRRVTINTYHVGDYIDIPDEVRMLVDPKSNYAQAMGYALGRAIDDIIIEAALGNAVSVTDSLAGSTGTVALPSGQIISEDFGTANSNLTVVKLIEARRILLKNDVDMDEPLYCVVNASALANLLNQTEVKSADYNTVKALVRGEVDTFLGFKFITMNRLQGVADGTDTNPIKCLVYARSGIGLATARDINVRMAEDPGKQFSTAVYASMDFGAVRIEEEKVVSILCVQAA